MVEDGGEEGNDKSMRLTSIPVSIGLRRVGYFSIRDVISGEWSIVVVDGLCYKEQS